MEKFNRREILCAALGSAATVVLGGIHGFQNRTREALSDLPEAIEAMKRSVYKVQGRNGHGSGFRVTPNHILTNFHVTHENAHRFRTDPQLLAMPNGLPLPLPPLSEVHDPCFDVSTFVSDDRVQPQKFRAPRIMLGNGRRAEHGDMALLGIPPDVRLDGTPVTFGRPTVGREVFAMGNPHSLTGHVTRGIVSKDLLISQEEGIWKGVPFLATDAAINGGNSGGPLFQYERKEGKLDIKCVGMNTWKTRGGEGMGGAIRGDYLAYIISTKWGIPLLSPQEIADFRREFPQVQ